MNLLILDVEGTIFKTECVIPETQLSSTVWQAIATALGPKAIEEELNTHRKWQNNEYNNYLEWMKDTINIHIRYGLTQAVFNKIISSAQYNTGVKDFFENLDRKKYLPVLISGGFQELASRAQIDFGIHHSFCGCSYYFENENLESYNLLPSDFSGKISFLEIIAEEYDIPSDKWIFVGDGNNDVDIAKSVKNSIGINPADKLAHCVKYTAKDFYQITNMLKEIENHA